MHGRRRARIGTTAALAGVCAALALAPAAQAGSREPLALAYAALHDSLPSPDAASRPDPKALEAARRGRKTNQLDSAAYEPRISSTQYGQPQMESVRATLDRLAHGPEMAQLSVYVATPAEIAEICGATVLACYLPEAMEMVVSGVDRPVAGVPRAFAIAHEYGHHIANTQRGDLLPAIEAGTIRWATYERVCQFTRSRRLFPGNQGAHYWQDPEEAFAESYAHLSDPQDSVSWQFTPLLQPTSASLAKIEADLSRPWQGPVTTTVAGAVAEPASGTASRGVTDPSGTAIDGATPFGASRATFSRLVRTPLDGRVSVSLQAPPGAVLAVSLRDPASGRILSRAETAEGGTAGLSYANCGHDSLRLEVRSLRGAGAFRAAVAKP